MDAKTLIDQIEKDSPQELALMQKLLRKALIVDFMDAHEVEIHRSPGNYMAFFLKKDIKDTDWKTTEAATGPTPSEAVWNLRAKLGEARG